MSLLALHQGIWEDIFKSPPELDSRVTLILMVLGIFWRFFWMIFMFKKYFLKIENINTSFLFTLVYHGLGMRVALRVTPNPESKGDPES